MLALLFVSNCRCLCDTLMTVVRTHTGLERWPAADWVAWKGSSTTIYFIRWTLRTFAGTLVAPHAIEEQYGDSTGKRSEHYSRPCCRTLRDCHDARSAFQVWTGGN